MESSKGSGFAPQSGHSREGMPSTLVPQRMQVLRFWIERSSVSKRLHDTQPPHYVRQVGKPPEGSLTRRRVRQEV